MSEPTIRKAKLDSLTPDQKNANRHTERGLGMLENSLQQHGAGRSILVDKHGNVIAGNATLETAIQTGFEDAIIVPTDGKQLVVVQRTDIDLDSPAGRMLALSDNRVAEIDLSYDPAILKELSSDGVDLSQLWTDTELSALLDIPPFQPTETPTDRLDQKSPIKCPHCGKEFIPRD